MEDIGQSLSEVVSFPVIAAGTAALKSAADFERFEKGLVAVSGSAQEAEKQLNRLQKIAEAPGIGFEQAVQASLQLQGLGVDAGRAEEAIKQVANIVAASGGGSQAFAGAIRQINQIQAKNRVLQEDINILLENAPTLGDVLQEAFGAKTAEAIRARGVDGEEFFDKLVAGLSKVERVQGGLFNTFENFGIAVRKALADLGQEIDRAVGIQDIIDRLTKSIQRAVEVFKNLDDETKRSLLSLAAFAAAIGPIIFVGSRIINVYRGVFAVFGTVAKASARLSAVIQAQTGATAANAAATGAASKATKGLAASFRALSKAQKATIIGLAVGAVAFLVSKFQEYRTAIKEASETRNALLQTEREAVRSADREIAKVDAVIEKYSKSNIKQKERAALLGRLQSQYPKYFSDLDAETTKVSDLKDAREQLRKSIIKTAKARAAESRITEVQDKILDLQEEQRGVAERLREEQQKLSSTTQELQANLFGSAREQDRIARGGVAAAREAKKLESQYSSLANEIGDLIKSQERLASLIDTSGASAPVASAPVASAPRDPSPDAPAEENVLSGAEIAQLDFNRALEQGVKSLNRIREASSNNLQSVNASTSAAQQAMLDYRDSINRVDVQAAALGEDQTLEDRLSILTEKINITKRALLSSVSAFGLNSASAETLQKRLAVLQGRLEKLREEQSQSKESTNAFAQKLKEVSRQITEGLNTAFESFFTTLVEGGKDAFGAFVEGLKKAVQDIITQLLSAIATALVLASILSLVLPGASFGSVFKNVLGGGNPFSFITGFAEGGIVPEGYPNDTYLARLSSGEAVIPLSRLESMLDSGSGAVVPSTTIRGEDIVISYERASKNINR
jgi:tape measure domain-containing protein